MGSFPRRTKLTLGHPTHLFPLSVFLFISRVIHVVLIFKSITLAVHLASTMAQSADCQKLEIQNTAISEGDIQAERRKETNIQFSK